VKQTTAPGVANMSVFNHISLSETVGDLKRRIEEKEGIGIEWQRIRNAGGYKELDDDGHYPIIIPAVTE